MSKQSFFAIASLLLLITPLLSAQKIRTFHSSTIYEDTSFRPLIEWNKTYGTRSIEEAWSMIEASDGGFALAGWIEPPDAIGTRKMLIIKTDSFGNLEWNQTYQRLNWDKARDLVESDDGGYVLAGLSGSGNENYLSIADYFLVKIDSDGNIEWSKYYDYEKSKDSAFGMTKTSDGGYVLIGQTHTGSGRGDYWIVKTNSKGNLEWNKAYGRPYFDRGLDVIPTSDGGYALVGFTQDSDLLNPDKGRQIWLIKIDSSGNIEWDKIYGGTYFEEANHIIETSDGGYLIPGTTSSFGNGGYDGWLIKIDSKGNVLWSKTFGGVYSDKFVDAVETYDGGYVIAGITNSFGDEDYDGWLIKTDSEGNVLWSLTFGGRGEDYLSSVVTTRDGGYAVAGYTRSYGVGNYDFWLVKVTEMHKINEEIYFETLFPGSIRVTVKLWYEYDGAPVEDAIVKINGLEARYLENGIYEVVLKSWMPIFTLNVNVKRIGSELASKESVVYSFGNILLETSGITILMLIVGIRLNAKRVEKKRWLINLSKIEEFVKEKGRIELSEASSILNVEIFEVKTLLYELMKDKRVVGTFTSDGRGFVTEEKLKEELIRRVEEREE